MELATSQPLDVIVAAPTGLLVVFPFRVMLAGRLLSRYIYQLKVAVPVLSNLKMGDGSWHVAVPARHGITLLAVFPSVRLNSISTVAFPPSSA